VADVVAPDGELCDHLVVMRRMPAGRRLSTLVAGGTDVGEEVRGRARLVAAFHARAERSAAADRAAGRDALAGRWAANTAAVLTQGRGVVPGDEVREVDALAARYLAGRGPLLERRIRDGRDRAPLRHRSGAGRPAHPPSPGGRARSVRRHPGDRGPPGGGRGPWPAATEVDTSAGPAEALTRAKALFGSGRPAQPAALTDTDTWRP
jgi:hypothetical protein